MSEPSIRRILDINERASANVIKTFNKDAAKIDPALSPFPLTVEAPNLSPPGRFHGRSATDLLKALDTAKGKELDEIEAELKRRGAL